MKRNILLLSYLVSLCLFFTACSDDDDKEVGTISIKEATKDTDRMVIKVKDNETLQLNVFIMPQNAKNKNVVFQNNSPELMEVTPDGIIKPAPLNDEWTEYKEGTITVKSTDGSGIEATFYVQIINHIVKAKEIKVTESGRNMRIEKGSTFDLAVEVSLSPDNTTDKRVTYKSKDETIATVDTDGQVSGIAQGSTQIVITTADGTNISTECNITVVEKITGPVDLSRANWTVETSYPPNIENPGASNENGRADQMFDSDVNTFLSLVKPGKLDIPEGTECFFIIDMQKEEKFGYFRMSYRVSVPSANLRVTKASVFGSNDKTTFTPIKEDIEFDTNINVHQIEFDEVVTYRYFKFRYDAWNDGGNTMQIGEFSLGNIIE